VSAEREQPGGLVGRVANSAANLAGRLGLITLIGGLGAIVITRLLGPSDYGQYAAAVATSSLLGAAADLGFSMMLARDLVDGEAKHRAMLRSAYQVALIWSTVLALVMVLLAFLAGIATARGLGLLILAPAMIFNGLNPGRALFLVTYKTGRLVRIDLATTTVQILGMTAVAALGLGPVAVIVVVALGSAANSLLVAIAAQKLLGPPNEERFGRRELVRVAAPLGLMTIMSKVYFTIDVVLLGWLVSGPQLGEYAAASKLLALFAGIAGVVIGSALPALSSQAKQRDELEYLSARVWHWLVVGAVPLFVGLAVFSSTVLRLTIGDEYDGAASLLQILAIAGVISVLVNLVGNIMVATHKMRALLIQNGAAIVVNVGLNLLLVPAHGVTAAAWITVGTEVMVCVGSLYALRHELGFRRCAEVSARPLIATAGAASAALALMNWPALAAAASVLAFGALMTALHAWPSEFRLPWVKLESTA